MNNPNFPLQVRHHFDFLFSKYRFSVESESYTGFPLAEWIIKLISTELCVQISIDKSQVFIDIGTPRKENYWFDLMYLMMYISQDINKWQYLRLGGEINEGYYDKQLVSLSEILKENYEQIKTTATNISVNKNEKKKFEKFVSKHSK